MDTTAKLHPGQTFSPETFKQLDGRDYTFGAAGQWQALIVLRGRHCPTCRSYLGKIEARREAFQKLGLAIAAVSADSEAQTRDLTAESKPTFPVLYGMDVAAMRRLGLYISEPRSPQETDHPFAEPALFVVNPEGRLQIVDLANAPFVRPDLDTVLGGLDFVMHNDYPVRGTRR